MILHLSELKSIPYGLGACVYAAEMENGIVKIGFSENPRTRMGALSSEAIRVFGTKMNKFYVSHIVVKRVGRDMERSVLTAARALSATHAKKKEFFYELPFDVAVSLICNEAVGKR